MWRFGWGDGMERWLMLMSTYLPLKWLVCVVCQRKEEGNVRVGRWSRRRWWRGVLTFTSCLAEIPPFLPVLNDVDEAMLGCRDDRRGMEMAMGHQDPGRERGVARPIAGGNEWLLYLPAADYVGAAMTGGQVNEHGHGGNSTYFTCFGCCLDRGPLQARETCLVGIATLLRTVCCREQLHWRR